MLLDLVHNSTHYAQNYASIIYASLITPVTHLLPHLLLLSPDGLLCPSQLSFLPHQLLSVLSLTGLKLLL